MLNIFPGPNINDSFLRKSLNNSLQLIVRYKVFDGYTVYTVGHLIISQENIYVKITYRLYCISIEFPNNLKQ